jgi:hypothetical protein
MRHATQKRRMATVERGTGLFRYRVALWDDGELVLMSKLGASGDWQPHPDAAAVEAAFEDAHAGRFHEVPD